MTHTLPILSCIQCMAASTSKAPKFPLTVPSIRLGMNPGDNRIVISYNIHGRVISFDKKQNKKGNWIYQTARDDSWVWPRPAEHVLPVRTHRTHFRCPIRTILRARTPAPEGESGESLWTAKDHGLYKFLCVIQKWWAVAKEKSFHAQAKANQIRLMILHSTLYSLHW